MIANAASLDAAHELPLERLAGARRYQSGFPLILTGIVVIVISAARAARTGKRLIVNRAQIGAKTSKAPELRSHTITAQLPDT